MNKRIAGAVLSAAATAVAVPLLLAQVVPASAASTKHHQDHGGTIRVEAWLYAVPSDNALSATVWDCFKVTGVINDEGGGPTWTDEASYTAPNSMTTGGQAAAAKECAAKEPAGGFGASPAPEPGQYPFASYTATEGAAPGNETGLTTIYAVHTLIAQKGDIYITYAGDYNFTKKSITVTLPDGSTVAVAPYTTGPACSWLITGGTGAYTGLEGSGACAANAQNTFPWINHTTTGNVWWPASRGNGDETLRSGLCGRHFRSGGSRAACKFSGSSPTARSAYTPPQLGGSEPWPTHT